MDNFDYDAPDYFLDFSKDLGKEDIEQAEAFFETEHKSHFGVQIDNDTAIHVDDSERDLDQDFYTPMKEPPKTENATKYLRNNLRKSLSMNNLPVDDIQLKQSNDDISTISNDMENLKMTGRSLKSTISNQKSHGMVTRANVPTLNLRTRSVSRDHLDKLAQPKRKNVSHEDLQAKKYVSMAEAISQFQHKTPKRFHTKSKTDFVPVGKITGPKPATIAQSPALATKQRARALNIMSREEQELQEYEEVRKYKIKANPINPKVLNGPLQIKPPVVKKTTKPEPFKLTEIPIKKPPTPTKNLFEFHAKPVPKSILEPPKPIIKSLLCTNPHTPKVMKRYTRAEPKTETINGIGQAKAIQPFKGILTKLEPFSFEERDKDLMKKREQLLNEVVEEEKKAREFHARPLPKSIFKSPQLKNSTICYQKRQKSDGSLYKSAEDMSGASSNVLAHTFKARPAKVLQMKPFEPKKKEHQIEFAEFQLSTDYRAKQREEFEQLKREKAEKIAKIMKEREEEFLRKEQEEWARIRKEAEHKAQPIRRYKAVQAVTAKKLTNPVSPKFTHLEKMKAEYSSNNKENSVNNSNTDS